MNVLVCGGAGYIGSNMTAMLAGSEGYVPFVYDNFSKGHRGAIGDVELIAGDLADFDRLVGVLRDKKIDAVMHFAAFIQVGESVEDPLKYYHNNFCNAHTLLCAMEAAGVDKFVFSSTAAVYGIPEVVPVTEDAATNPINPYGESKLAVERMCGYLSAAGKLRYTALRYFNACGAGADGTIGEDHDPESHLIPLIIAAAMGKREDIKIYGTDYPTADGTCVRDYIHIEDLCKAHLLALAKLDEQRELVYNLGNGTGYSVREVIDTVRKVSGKEFKVVEVGRRAGDPPVLTADASKARQELGWVTDFPELEPIVESAWKWHLNNPSGYAN